MIRFCTTRLPFIVAAALIAAALGDFLVESISNSGVFGTRYFDRNHLSVVRTLIAGLVLILDVSGARRLASHSRCKDIERDWLLDVATQISVRPAASDLPYVFAMQLCALFAMESVEQLTFGGRLLGGTVWLGGPVLLSLLVHAGIGALCTFLLDSLIRAVLRTVASLIGNALAFVWLAIERASSAVFVSERDGPPCFRAQAPRVRQIGCRAPPLLPAPV